MCVWGGKEPPPDTFGDWPTGRAGVFVAPIEDAMGLLRLKMGLHTAEFQTPHPSRLWDCPLPVLLVCPHSTGHVKKNPSLVDHPQKRPVSISWWEAASQRQRSDKRCLWWALQTCSRKHLFCRRKAPQCRMNQIPPASVWLHYIWIIILKCTLMLKKSLLQNFKATIKYSIVMAQLNGLAWENWGL